MIAAYGFLFIVAVALRRILFSRGGCLARSTRYSARTAAARSPASCHSHGSVKYRITQMFWSQFIVCIVQYKYSPIYCLRLTSLMLLRSSCFLHILWNCKVYDIQNVRCIPFHAIPFDANRISWNFFQFFLNWELFVSVVNTIDYTIINCNRFNAIVICRTPMSI